MKPSSATLLLAIAFGVAFFTTAVYVDYATPVKAVVVVRTERRPYTMAPRIIPPRSDDPFFQPRAN